MRDTHPHHSIVRPQTWICIDSPTLRGYYMSHIALSPCLSVSLYCIGKKPRFHTDLIVQFQNVNVYSHQNRSSPFLHEMQLCQAETLRNSFSCLKAHRFHSRPKLLRSSSFSDNLPPRDAASYIYNKVGLLCHRLYFTLRFLNDFLICIY